MYICNNCKSDDIIDTEDYSVWFREGNFLRRRIVAVWEQVNSNGDVIRFWAMCPEYAGSPTSFGSTKLQAIRQLGRDIEKTFYIKMMGETLEEG